MSSKSSKNGVYEILVAQEDRITKIMGIITPEAVNNHEKELGWAFTILKSNHFSKGQPCRYLMCIILQAKYCIVIMDPARRYTAPANPGACANAALVVG
jgi:hypothetical protein